MSGGSACASSDDLSDADDWLSSSRGDLADLSLVLLAIAGLVLYGWLWASSTSLGRERR